MLVRLRIKRKASGTVIDYCHRISREHVSAVGCNRAICQLSEEIGDKFSTAWIVEIRQVAEHEYDNWLRDNMEFRLALQKCGLFYARGAI